MPPPPPPPPPSFGDKTGTNPAPSPPPVASKGPDGAFLVELITYNGHPFKDHWAYFVRSNTRFSRGVLLHATGDVRHGFKFEIKRYLDFVKTLTKPSARIPLQWVHGEYFNEKEMFNNGTYVIDTEPVCQFEASVNKVKAPEKSLSASSAAVRPTPLHSYYFTITPYHLLSTLFLMLSFSSIFKY